MFSFSAHSMSERSEKERKWKLGGEKTVNVIMIGCQRVLRELYNMGGAVGLYQGKISSHCFHLSEGLCNVCAYVKIYVVTSIISWRDF